MPSERVQRPALQLRFEWTEIGLEEVQYQTVGLQQYGPDFVLHQTCKHDRTPAIFFSRPIDPRCDVACLSHRDNERHGHGVEDLVVELLEQALTERFNRHAGLIGDKKHFMCLHCLTILH